MSVLESQRNLRSTVPLYSGSHALLTDRYQITMGQGYFRNGIHEKEACFHLFFRSTPFGGGYALAGGLSYVIDYIRAAQFGDAEVEYLAQVKGNDGNRMFDPAFLNYLRKMRWSISVDGIPEGTLVFPHEPILRVTGPLLQCQLVESIFLNMVNFTTLVATRASRICYAARGEPVLEFGLRRAQGIDGSLSASLAAYLGGVNATSNDAAGFHFGIPVAGTHAHSWVMIHDSEREAFQKYAEALPNNCLFLVDTYDTLQGVKHAIEVARKIKENGQKFVGIRLDSGDLAALSAKARVLLDQAGFTDAAIVASNDLDEFIIDDLKRQKSEISVWGVGTNLVTGEINRDSPGRAQPALGGVYKIAALRDNGVWKYRIKVSEQRIKTSNPGPQQVRRYLGPDGTYSIGDCIYAIDQGPPTEGTVQTLDAGSRSRFEIDPRAGYLDLLIPVIKDGSVLGYNRSVSDMREHALAELAKLSDRTRRFKYPELYIAGLAPELEQTKSLLLEQVLTGQRTDS